LKLLSNILLCLILSHCLISYSQSNRKLYGVTIDAVSNLNNIVASVSNHRSKMAVRIVFDEWVPASYYINSVNRLDSVCIIMGELLDSYYVNSYSIQQYKSRTDEYFQTLGNKVDIWEIGNEINGEWLGHKDSVIAKITYAYNKAKSLNYSVALTFYYNKDCWQYPQNEMFRWINQNIPVNMKNNLDYVLVSYYEDDCNNYQPNWQQVFDSLSVIFPNSKLGIGECGTLIQNRKEEYINRYYRMHITTPRYIGGYFWWYYKQDCVPWTTKPLWGVLEYAIRASNLFYDEYYNNTFIKDGDGY
jgi:hypothetical protein